MKSETFHEHFKYDLKKMKLRVFDSQVDQQKRNNFTGNFRISAKYSRNFTVANNNFVYVFLYISAPFELTELSLEVKVKREIRQAFQTLVGRYSEFEFGSLRLT